MEDTPFVKNKAKPYFKGFSCMYNVHHPVHTNFKEFLYKFISFN